MILTRCGSKRLIASQIIRYFPEHETYIEPFFGAGGMFFHKPQTKYNIVNDLDDEVFNLFMVIKNQRSEFLEALTYMPIHGSLLNYWKHVKENEPISKALRFLLKSNYTFYGGGDTLRLSGSNMKEVIKLRSELVAEKLGNVVFTNMDFEKFLNSIRLRKNTNKFFIYADPPYVSTTTHKKYEGFTLADHERLLDCLIRKGVKFAVSEFDNPDIIELATRKGLTITIIGERQNIKNRRTEILITNYLPNALCNEMFSKN